MAATTPKVPMLTATTGLAAIRPHYAGEAREMLRVLLNAVSPVEANFALELLSDAVAVKPLVTAMNLREVLQNLPSSPFEMRVDEETLLRVAGLQKDRALMRRTLPDGIELAVTTAGNLVLDIIARIDGAPLYWSPMPTGSDFVNPALLDTIIESDHLLENVVELAQAMGIVYNPKFYLSLEDWRLDHAAVTMESIEDLF